MKSVLLIMMSQCVIEFISNKLKIFLEKLFTNVQKHVIINLSVDEIDTIRTKNLIKKIKKTIYKFQKIVYN